MAQLRTMVEANGMTLIDRTEWEDLCTRLAEAIVDQDLDTDLLVLLGDA